MNKLWPSMWLFCLLRFHLGDFFTRVNQLAEPPLLGGLAWACWATSWICSCQGEGSIDRAISLGDVLLMDLFDTRGMFLEWGRQGWRAAW